MDGYRTESYQQNGVSLPRANSAEMKYQEIMSKRQSGAMHGKGKHMEGSTNISVQNRINSLGTNAVPTSGKSVAFSKQLSMTVGDDANQGGNNTGANPNRSLPNNRNAPTNSTAGVGTVTTHHSLVRVGNQFKNESPAAPLPGMDAATLRRHVESLQIDLYAHKETEQQLRAINQQLRDRLEMYMKQNHDNVERAENELNTLHEDMEQTLALQARLAQRVSALEKEKKEVEQSLQKRLQEVEAERISLQAQINSLSQDLHASSDAQARASALKEELATAVALKTRLENDLQNYINEKNSLKKKVQEYSDELKSMMERECLEHTIMKHGRKSLLRRCLIWFKQAIDNQRMEKAYEHTAIAFALQSCSRRGLRSLYVATYRAKIIRIAYNRQAAACLQECWRSWRMETHVQKKLKSVLKRKTHLCLMRVFHSWKQMIEIEKISDTDEQHMIDLAHSHWHVYLLRRTWVHWVDWIRFWIQPQKRKLECMKEHLDRLSCMQTMVSWKSLIHAKHLKSVKIARACIQGNLWSQKRAFYRWQEHISHRNLKHLRSQKAAHFWMSKFCSLALRRWQNFVLYRRQRHTSKSLAYRHYLHVLQSKAIGAWKLTVKIQQAELKAQHEINQALMKAVMVFWREYHALYAIKKKKERRALLHRKRREQKVGKAIFAFLREQMIWRRRIAHFERILASRRHRLSLINALHRWMHATFDHLLTANVKFQKELLEAQAQCEAQQDQTAAVDVENLQLIDRLHSMSSEIAMLKITISEKEKQEEDIHRALEDGTAIENSMREELDKQHFKIEDLEQTASRLQKQLMTQNAEDSAEETHHSMEIESLQWAIKDSQAQLKEKTSQIEYYEKWEKDGVLCSFPYDYKGQGKKFPAVSSWQMITLEGCKEGRI